MRGLVRSALLVAAGAGAGAALAACGGRQAPLQSSEPWRTRPLDQTPNRASNAALHPLIVVDGPTDGPFLARRGASAVAAWLAAPSGLRGEREIWLAPLGETGGKLRPATSLGTTPKETTRFAVRPVGPIARPVFVTLFTALEGAGEVLHGQLAASAPASSASGGSPTSSAGPEFRAGRRIDIGGGDDSILWFDAVATEKGFAAAWAEETADGAVRVSVRPFDAGGGPLAPARVVAPHAAGWALAAPEGDGGGFALATVDAVGKNVHLATFSAEGDAESDLPLPGTEGARGALAFGATEQGAILAFDDGRDVKIASENGAKVALRGARLLDGQFAARGAWLVVRPSNGDPAALVPIAANGEPGAAIGLPDVPVTEGMSAYGDALVGVLPAERCEERTACASPRRFLVRVGETNVAVQTIAAGADPLSFVWGVRCGIGGCLALAATGEADTHVGAFSLFDGSKALATTVPTAASAPATNPSISTPSPPQTAPTNAAPVAATALPRTKHGAVQRDILANEDAGMLAEGYDAGNVRRGLLATISTHTWDAVAKKGAKVSVLPWRADEGKVAAPTVITEKALAEGGVALALARDAKQGAAVAWVGRDAGDPEVHLTRVDGAAKKQMDIQLTAAKGDAGDVALVAVDGGWLVLWIDGRNGKGEVYATRVDYALRRIAREERITPASLDATDLSVVADGNDAWVTYVDGPTGAAGNVQIAHVSGRDARRLGDVVTAFAGSGVARTPKLAISSPPGGRASAEAPAGTENGAPRAALVWRQATTRGAERAYGCLLTLSGPTASCRRPVTLGGDEAEFAGLSLDPIRFGHGALLRRDGGRATLALFDLAPAQNPSAIPLSEGVPVDARTTGEIALLPTYGGPGPVFFLGEMLPDGAKVSRLSFAAP